MQMEGPNHGGRGQGEPIVSMPVPPPRRRLSKSLMDQEVTENCPLPSTIHVTSVGVEGRPTYGYGISTTASNPPRKSWLKIILYFGLASLLTFIAVGLTLDYFDLWDPCVIKIPYEKHCTVDSYAGGMFFRTDFREEFFCIVPGVFYSTKTTGWNTDGVCESSVSDPTIS